MKTQILAAIGENVLQPAAQMNEALAANDRIKYRFSLLQVALSYAEHPDGSAGTLKKERLACGIDDPDLYTVVAGSRMAGKLCRVPGAARILSRLVADLGVMAAPVLAEKPKDLAARIDKLLKALPAAKHDLLDPDAVSAMMQASHNKADSLHRLVMDLHKRLNAMQADLSEEKVDGASVYGLSDPDRPLVSAFMAGVNRTARLKFNHPGLATSATRSGNRLVIQNDIGTTDARVIVLHVEALTVSVTYPDVHPERLGFFKEMLQAQAVIWDEENTAMLAEGAPFYMAIGHVEAKDTDSCSAYLQFIGSRLVFLIDWNHARKQLRGFLRGPDRLALLSWAAKKEIGHRGFLELGGAHLVNQAIEATAGSSMHLGDRLCDILGDAEAVTFLRFVFQTATEGLLSNQSQALIQDRIRVTLAAQFSNEERQLLRLAADHAGQIFELASLVRDGLHGGSDDAEKHTRRARRFEHDADHLVIETREAVRLRPDYAIFLPLMEAADNAADGLEDAAFLIDLGKLHGKPLDALTTLADLLAEASQEWIKAVGHATQIGLAASALETEDFLAAIDRLDTLERQADDAERALTARAIKDAKDFHDLYLCTRIGCQLEEASDALRHASLILRDYMLQDVIDG
jgi:uncharacterized protein Yka (UPF0111/DUF47 family)